MATQDEVDEMIASYTTDEADLMAELLEMDEDDDNLEYDS